MLNEIILEDIRKATYYARAKTKEFVEFINKKSSSENSEEFFVWWMKDAANDASPKITMSLRGAKRRGNPFSKGSFV